MATFEIPGVYLHTETDKDVIIYLEGALADIMMKVSPKIYQKYVIMSIKGKLLLCIQIKKSSHGLIRSEKLFHRKLLNYIESHGFQINSYDPCVANNMLNKIILW